MICAGCKQMFPGIVGLMPRKLPGKARNMQTHEMLCKDCHKERNEQGEAYRQATQGS